MKSRILFLCTFIVFMFIAAQSCGHKHSHDESEKQGKEYTSAYICPMHCEGSGSDEPGKCPVCDMDYVANEDHKADGHSHDDDSHEGHNH